MNALTSWMLDSDPALRWQVMRDVLGAPEHEVNAERARVATEGLGAQLLALQGSDGRWGNAAWNHGWNSTMHVLMLLRELGLDPSCVQARRALELVSEHVTWKCCAPDECDDNPFFAGEVEPCINGQVALVGAYFGQDVTSIVERLLAEQLADGGWNCDAERGSTRSSFNTTICVLEALLEVEKTGTRDPRIERARLLGQEYLLERRLMRQRSTGEVIPCDRKSGADFQRFAFPTWWHYDVLRALDYLRLAGVTDDARLSEALDLVASKPDVEGRWPLEATYAGVMPLGVHLGGVVPLGSVTPHEKAERLGEPSRWITLRALRVLNTYAPERLSSIRLS